LELGKPLEFNKSEKHSFAEWLQLTSFQPIDRSSENEVEIETETEAEKEAETIVPKEGQKKRFELVDKFIDTNSRKKWFLCRPNSSNKKITTK